MDARNPAMAIAFAPEPAAAGFPIVARRLLNLVLFVTVLTSSIAFIEPSPHDALMIVLLAICVGARVGFDRKLVPLLVLLIVWLVGGLLCLIQVGDNAKDIQYAGTSLYLGLAAIMFACLFGDGDLLRLAIMRRAYIVAALIATAAGYIGFFHLLPGADIFLENDRVSATFKDPNVYGPFLIFPILWLLIELLTRGVRLFNMTALALLLGGLLLSFSRGAWAHFVISATVGIGIVLVVTPDPRMRVRIVMLGLLGAVVAALLIVAAMSIGSVHDMFVERAKAIQPYDVGPGGRFWQQELAINAILDNPNGLGPFEFDRIFGLQQHNVYMQGFLVYGWLGGAAYLTLVAVTLVFGLLTVSTQTPWQYYLITAYAVFVGEACEGMIVDTDHWRHFFLMLGLVWGLGAATINDRRRQTWGIEPDEDLALVNS
ncbi:MAG TPA: O-antigen ligase family protein [Xanthobacteraceae bacterium]|nr:O-antigen ligase family protein [Xanthobacteraceae bacterium]